MDDKNTQTLPQGEDSEERELASQDAHQAVALGRMRTVMAISIVLVVLMFAMIYFGAI